MPVYKLPEDLIFPSPHLATGDGLLAVGGDLSRHRLLLAYSHGIFPWYSEGEPILWWSPDPRLVLYPHEFKVPRSLNKVIKKGTFKVTLDRAFEKVITECARVRLENREGTWIVDDMVQAYCRLHAAGFAHSVETWRNGNLAGGLYGVTLGGAFFGESMFHRVSDASKVALVKLVERLRDRGYELLDVQFMTEHLRGFGAIEIPRDEYGRQLEQAVRLPCTFADS